MEIKKGQVWECVKAINNPFIEVGLSYIINKIDEKKNEVYFSVPKDADYWVGKPYLINNFKLVEEEQDKSPSYYNNEKGSIYQFCNEQGLNSYEFDIIKRVVRCRKKGLFAEDLQKTKNLIDLYLKEFNHEK